MGSILECNTTDSDIIKFICDEISSFYLFAILFSIVQYFLVNKVNFLSLIFSLIFSTAFNFILNKKITLKLDQDFYTFAGLSLFYLFVLYLYIYAYPFFPSYYSVDFFVHTSNSLNLVYGKANIENIFSANPAISLLLASWLSIGFENILFFSRVFMLFVLYSSLPFVYFLGKQIFNKGGIISSLIYIMINPFAVFTLVYTGLYSNALGLTLSLGIITWFIQSLNDSKKIRCFLIPFYSLSLLLAHSSNILVYFVLIISSLYLIYFERSNISFKPLIYLLFGPLIILVFVPTIIFRLPSTLTSPYILIEIPSNELIAYILRNLPFLKYFYFYGGENIFVLLLLLISIVLGIIYFLKKRLGLAIYSITWIILIIIISLFSTNVWRFVLLAYTPTSLFSPFIYNKVISPAFRKVVEIMPSKALKRAFKCLLIIFMFILLYLPSYSNIIVTIYASSWSRPQQEGFYECLIWFRDNSEVDSVIISIGGGSYIRFMPLVSNRALLDVFPGQVPEFAYDVLKNYSNGYVVVWNRLHPYNGSFYYVDLYKNSSLFREVWSNKEVTVFKLVK